MSKQERRLRLPKTPDEAIDTLERFVVRARRIEAHSLVRSRKIEEFAQPNYTLSFSGSSISMRLNSRPEDEEVFESLAARIRPCIVDSEPIQLEKVVAATRVLTSEIKLTERQLRLLDSVDAWCKNHIAPHSYAPISSHEEIGRVDSDEVTPASDTLLGLGWYYADLVHADPQQEKETALKFPYDARYNQGVLLVSHLALIIRALLRMIRDVDSTHDLGLSPEIWEAQVTAGGGPFEFGVGEVYVGPTGCEPPVGVPLDQMPGFKKLDAVTARRMQYPNCAVDARFVDDDETVIDTYEGFYAIDKDRNRVVININNEILFSGEPKDATPVEQLPFNWAFYSKTAEPVDDNVERFTDFLTRAKAAGHIDIVMTWRGAPVRGTITFPKTPLTHGEQMPVGNI